MLQKHARELNLPLFYVNQVGANTELIFDGDSLALAPDGYIVTRDERFVSTFVDVTYDAGQQKLQAGEYADCERSAPNPIETMYHALVLGVARLSQKIKAR